MATQKTKQKTKKPSPRIGKVVGLVFFCFFVFFGLFCFFLVFLLSIFRFSNNFKNFEKYPDSFCLLYDQGETFNQHDNKKLNKVKDIESNHYTKEYNI